MRGPANRKVACPLFRYPLFLCGARPPKETALTLAWERSPNGVLWLSERLPEVLSFSGVAEDGHGKDGEAGDLFGRRCSQTQPGPSAGSMKRKRLLAAALAESKGNP
jgi:hypothetical protein